MPDFLADGERSATFHLSPPLNREFHLGMRGPTDVASNRRVTAVRLRGQLNLRIGTEVSDAPVERSPSGTAKNRLNEVLRHAD